MFFEFVFFRSDSSEGSTSMTRQPELLICRITRLAADINSDVRTCFQIFPLLAGESVTASVQLRCGHVGRSDAGNW